MRLGRTSFAIAPQKVAAYGAALLGLFAWVTVWLAAEQPWLGIELEIADGSRVLVAGRRS